MHTPLRSSSLGVLGRYFAQSSLSLSFFHALLRRRERPCMYKCTPTYVLCSLRKSFYMVQVLWAAGEGGGGHLLTGERETLRTEDRERERERERLHGHL